VPGRRTFTAFRPTLLACLLFLVTLPAVTPRFYASDEVEFFAWLRSAVFDGDANFDNEYRYFHDAGIVPDAGFRATFLEQVTTAATTSRRLARRSCGRRFSPLGISRRM